MAEPVNLDLWQIAAEQGPVNLDLGATDAETVYSSTISATSKPTTATIPPSCNQNNTSLCG